MNTNELQAGPELDALVAEKVMGWKIHVRNTAWWVDAEIESGLIPAGGVRGLTCGTDRWSPSTSIKAAWEVVEKIESRREVALMRWGDSVEPKYRGLWRLIIEGVDAVPDYMGDKTAPLAICRAALLAVGVEA